MAHNEIYPSGVSHTCLGIEWNSASYTTYVTIAPTIWRWDEANTANTGGRWSESLSPDPQGAGYWSGLSWGTGYGWRQIDSFATRTYNRTKSTQTVKLTITTDASYGTYWYGWVNYGTKSVSWTLTIDPLPSYNVTFNANSGSGAPATQKKWYNESLTLSSTKPTRTGYTFKQWNTKADGTGTAYAPGATYTGNAALSLYAIWTINTWTVAYNANGHGTAPASQTKTYGTNLTLRSGMGTVSNYVWKSWNTAANGSGTTYGSGAAYSTNGAATMYAQWYAPYTVSYNANGGTGAPAAQTKVYNQTLTLSATVPTRANHDFLGWATSATAETPTYRTGDDHSGNATYSTNAALSLYAVWKIAHSNPSISYLNVKRCVSSQDGTPADDGEGCLVTANVAIDNTTEGYFDTVIRSVTVQVGSNAPETVTVGASDTTAQIEFVPSNTLSLTSTYAVKVTVEDSYGFSSYKTSNISIAYFTMHFKEGGHGIAIGKKSTVDNLFDVNMNTSVNGNLDASGSLTIDGNSTVNGSLAKFKGQVINYANGQRGTTPSANLYRTYEFQDTEGRRLSQVESGLLSSGYNVLNLYVLGHYTSADDYSGIQIYKTNGNTGNYTAQYNANTGRFYTKSIETPDRAVSYVDGSKGDAAVYARKAYNVDHWYPAVCLETKGGGSWQMGNYNSEQLELVYTTKALRDASNNNIPGHIYLSAPPAARNWYVARILYDNNTGTNGTVTLAETAANFAFMFIGFRTNESEYDGVFVRSPNGKKVTFITGDVSATNINLKTRTVTISGTSVTTVSGSTVHASINNSAQSGSNYIYTTHVIGFA